MSKAHAGEWAKKAMSDDVVAEYRAAGWNTEYNEEYEASDGIGKGALLIKPISQ